MQHSRASGAVAVLVSVLLVTGALAVLPFGTGVVGAASVEVTECTVIDRSGTYVLTGDIDGTTSPAVACIRIQSSNVTLDGQGYTVTNTGRGVEVQAEDSDTVRLENVVLRNLTVDAGTYGVVSYRAGTVVDGVDVLGRGGWGVVLQFGDLTVSNSSIVFEDVPEPDPFTLSTRGVYVFSGNLTLADSTVSITCASGLSCGSGVQLSPSPTVESSVLVSGSAISAGTGLYATTGEWPLVVIEGSRIDAQQYGVWARFGTSADLVVRDNDITTGRYGVWLEGDGHVVTDNRITGPAEVGIALLGNGTLAERNVVTGSTGVGIGVVGEAGLLRDNAVNETSGVGFLVLGTDVSVVRATVNPTLSFVGDDVSLSAAEAPADGTDGLVGLGGYATVALGQATPLALGLNYTDEDALGLDESSLALYRYDEAAGAWVPLADGAVDPAGNVVSGTLAETAIVAAFGAPATDTVEVDIAVKPGADPAPVNPKARGVVPVAVLHTDEFDPATVNVSSLRFGDAEDVAAGLGATAVHGGHAADVDGDGDLDLVVHFDARAAGFDGDETVAVLVGATADGTALTGEDEVVVVGRPA
ncbi:right-handed parallel beta-helix repeat-containing protein [Halosegnis marinus]|uniref:Right-handed parallel beta-helix repeat-containing protein n=1 Tax=Halosegnis marinus TaxID=3034023 RepID=A0ABD5ZKK5_9EURY|nr:right-handed parallel beta-helix repeat-containing protein [Halosegnis sp. DT85]